MSRVTDEEYNRAKEMLEICQSCRGKSYEHIMELIDELSAERNNYETYGRAIEHNREIIMRYEIGREVYGGNNETGI